MPNQTAIHQGQPLMLDPCMHPATARLDLLDATEELGYKVVSLHSHSMKSHLTLLPCIILVHAPIGTVCWWQVWLLAHPKQRLAQQELIMTRALVDLAAPSTTHSAPHPPPTSALAPPPPGASYSSGSS